jgi:hypothetical protein
MSIRFHQDEWPPRRLSASEPNAKGVSYRAMRPT